MLLEQTSNIFWSFLREIKHWPCGELVEQKKGGKKCYTFFVLRRVLENIDVTPTHCMKLWGGEHQMILNVYLNFVERKEKTYKKIKIREEG